MKKDYWQLGRLLDTPYTRQLPTLEKTRLNDEERRMVFRNFSFEDQGRSRTRVAIFDTQQDAKRAVEDHNAAEDRK